MATAFLDRDRVIRAAADVADRDGWLHLTMSNVATAVDRHVASLYGHVDGIADLRQAVQLLALAELADRCRDAAHGKTGEPALVALLDVYREHTRDHPGRSAALVDVDLHDPEVRRLGGRVAEPFLVTLRGFGVPETRLQATQTLLSVSVRGFGMAEASGRFGSRSDADAAFAQLRRLFVGALAGGAWPADRP